jgi:hypothetical protein
MATISNDPAEGLGLSLTIYVAAIAAAVVVLGTPIYFATKAVQHENPGLAAYRAPPGTRVIPEMKQNNDLALDLGERSKPAATKSRSDDGYAKRGRT